MESGGSAHVQVEIGVMHVVKAPEERDQMIGPVQDLFQMRIDQLPARTTALHGLLDKEALLLKVRNN